MERVMGVLATLTAELVQRSTVSPVLLHVMSGVPVRGTWPEFVGVKIGVPVENGESAERVKVMIELGDRSLEGAKVKVTEVSVSAMLEPVATARGIVVPATLSPGN